MSLYARYTMRTAIAAALLFSATVLPAERRFSAQTPSAQERELRNAEYATIGGKRVLVHIVRPKETLYSLCKTYGVTQESLLKLNPSLSGGLKSGATLIIKEVTAQEVAESATGSSAAGNFAATNSSAEGASASSQDYIEFNGASQQDNDNYLFGEESITNPQEVVPAEESGNGTTSFLIGNEIKSIGLILPLNTSAGSYSNNYMDFYAGALLAAEDLKEAGHAITLQVYDQSEIGSLGKGENLESFAEQGLIVGPIKREEIESIAPFLAERGVPMVSPMDSKVSTLLSSFPQLVQIPPAQKAYHLELSNAIIESCRGDQISRVTILRESGTSPDPVESAVEAELRENGIEINIIQYGILEGREILQRIKNGLSVEEKNIIFCHSSNEAFITDAVRNIGLCISEGIQITTFGNANWKNINVINAEQLHAINLHLIVNYHIDYSREEVKEFLYRYRALFNAEPSAFSYQGYDIIRYFAGNLFPGEEPSDTSMLQIKFKLRRELGSGFSNWGMHHIVYNPDYTITEE